MNTDTRPQIEKNEEAARNARAAAAQRNHEERMAKLTAESEEAERSRLTAATKPLLRTGGKLDAIVVERGHLDEVRARQEADPNVAQRATDHRMLRKQRRWMWGAIAVAGILDAIFVMPNLVSALAVAMSGGDPLKMNPMLPYQLASFGALVSAFVLMILKQNSDVTQRLAEVRMAPDTASLNGAKHRLLSARACKVAGMLMITIAVGLNIAVEYGKKAEASAEREAQRKEDAQEAGGLKSDAASTPAAASGSWWSNVPSSAAILLLIWMLHMMVFVMPSGGSIAPLDQARFAPELIEKRLRTLDHQTGKLAQKFRTHWAKVEGDESTAAHVRLAIAPRVWALAGVETASTAPIEPVVAAEPVEPEPPTTPATDPLSAVL